MDGPVIVVTGATGGLGKAITKSLLDDINNRLFLTSRSNDLLNDIYHKYPNRVQYDTTDLEVPGSAKTTIKKVLATFGRIDAIIINHGTLEPVSRLENADSSHWSKSFQTNFFSALEMVKEAIPELRQRRGRVLFVSSGAAVTPYLAWGAYGAAKASMNHLAATLAAEEPNITSIAIRPGVIDTKMQEDIRTKYAIQMGSDFERFRNLKFDEKLLPPEKPGLVIAQLAVCAPSHLSGRFLNWDSDELASGKW